MPYRKEEKLPDNFGIDWTSGKEIGHNFIIHLFHNIQFNEIMKYESTRRYNFSYQTAQILILISSAFYISFCIICYFVDLHSMNWTIFRSIWFFYNCSRGWGMANLRTFWKSNIFVQILRILQGIILGWNWRQTFWLRISGCTLLE